MFARGRRALAICERCGFSYPYRDIEVEPGTGWRVCSTCNDGNFSAISHPQNYPAIISEDPQGLEYARPDTPMDAVTSITFP